MFGAGERRRLAEVVAALRASRLLEREEPELLALRGDARARGAVAEQRGVELRLRCRLDLGRRRTTRQIWKVIAERQVCAAFEHRITRAAGDEIEVGHREDIMAVDRGHCHFLCWSLRGKNETGSEVADFFLVISSA